METFLNCHFVHRTLNARKIDPTVPEKLDILLYTSVKWEVHKKGITFLSGPNIK